MTLPVGKTCGQCQFAELYPQDVSRITCFGAPPTPVLMSAQPDRLGRVNMAVEVIRPVIAKGTKACGMFRQALAIDVSR